MFDVLVAVTVLVLSLPLLALIAIAIKLDSPEAAKHFNDQLINACIRAQSVPRAPGSGRLTVAIVGGGATGVELSAELHAAARVLGNYGFDHIRAACRRAGAGQLRL